MIQHDTPAHNPEESAFRENSFWGRCCIELGIPNNVSNRKRLLSAHQRYPSEVILCIIYVIYFVLQMFYTQAWDGFYTLILCSSGILCFLTIVY